ncbi:MAG: GntR family transcriptional regulator [Gammaproteobacteria bacterium]|nr:GntR family transcriptional regulator [Pseudomonadales bacterium]MCP5345766.1 GntR family transcriptional regulator [Pseudomonadales bacterium]
MQISWNDKEPIYLQLRDRLVELILDGALPEGEPLPSVRQISSEQRINPITVSKAFQLMVDEGLVEKRRGRGMYVVTGAQAKLTDLERQQFLDVEWPAILRRVARLGLAVDELPGSPAADPDQTADRN